MKTNPALSLLDRAVGTWTVTATDTSNGSIKGTSQSVDVEN